MNRNAYKYNLEELEKSKKKYNEISLLYGICLLLFIFFVVMFFLNFTYSNIPWLISLYATLSFVLASDYRRIKIQAMSQINAIESKIQPYKESLFFINDKVSYKSENYVITAIYSNSVILNNGFSVDISEIRLIG